MLRTEFSKAIAASMVVLMAVSMVMAQTGGVTSTWRDGRFVDTPAAEDADSTGDTPQPATAPQPTTPPVPAWTAGRTAPIGQLTGPMRTASVVNVRSGPGAYYYEVAKLAQGTTVNVVATESGWSAIAPTSSMRALVRQDAITMQGANEGIVDAAGKARVYASGSRSTETWAVIDQLSTGEKVRILGSEGNFHQIEMPQNARAWIQSDLLQPTDDAQDDTTGDDPLDDTGSSLPPIKPIPEDPMLPVYQKALAEHRKEMQKELGERNLAPLAEIFKEVTEKAEMSYLKAAAADELRKIERQQFLLESLEESRRHKEQLDRDMAAIRQQAEQERSRVVQEAATQPIVAPEFEGMLRKNMATSAYPYRVEDNNGRFLAMLKSETVDLEPFNGRVVRIWGDKRYLPDWRLHGVEVHRVEETK